MKAARILLSLGVLPGAAILAIGLAQLTSAHEKDKVVSGRGIGTEILQGQFYVVAVDINTGEQFRIANRRDGGFHLGDAISVWSFNGAGEVEWEKYRVVDPVFGAQKLDNGVWYMYYDFPTPDVVAADQVIYVQEEL